MASKNSLTFNNQIVVNDQLPVFKTVVGHFSKAPFLLTPEMFGGLNFEVACKEISSMIGSSVSDLHAHEHPEIYMLISPQEGEAEIAIETKNGHVYKMTSPAVAYIPAHVEHRFVVHKAVQGSFCLGILLHK